MAPIRFVMFVLGLVFTMGLMDSYGRLVLFMANAAGHAYLHDQISYSAYTRLLWSDKPKLRRPGPFAHYHERSGRHRSQRYTEVTR